MRIFPRAQATGSKNSANQRARVFFRHFPRSFLCVPKKSARAPPEHRPRCSTQASSALLRRELPVLLHPGLLERRSRHSVGAPPALLRPSAARPITARVARAASPKCHPPYSTERRPRCSAPVCQSAARAALSERRPPCSA
jgi:hypothetical protein